MVQRGRSVPTLSAVKPTESPKEQLNTDTKSEERGETSNNDKSNDVFQHLKNIPVAGRPSDTPRRTSYGGRRYVHKNQLTCRGGESDNQADSPQSGLVNNKCFPYLTFSMTSTFRSRRNSVDENASQLSLENLGGSQDNLQLLGRNPVKEMRTHTGRRHHEDRFIDNKELEEMEKQEKQESVKLAQDQGRGDRGEKVSFADLRRQKARDTFHSSGISINYNHDPDDEVDKVAAPPNRRSSLLQEQQRNKLREQQSSTSSALTSWASAKHHQPQENQNSSTESTSPGNHH